MDCRSSSTIPDGIEDFDSLRQNVTGKLNLEHWIVLPSQRTLHIFSVNKMLNGNLSIRNTIFIDVDLIVKVFGENNDDMLCSLKLYSWPQLQTLIEQYNCAHNKRDVDLEFAEILEKPTKSETNSCEVKHQQDDTVEVEFRVVNTKTEVEDSYIHEPLTELIERSMVEAFGYNQTFVSQRSSLHETPPIHSEDANPTAKLMHHKTIERYIPQSQICPVCGRTYVGDMDRHMDQHFNGKSYQCHVCGRQYQNSYDLVKHVKSKHFGAGDEFFCDICKTHPVFETKASIEDHMTNKHCEAPKKQGSMKCSTCGKEFFTQKQFTAHVSGHDQSKWKPCPICNKRYRCLNRHMRDMHLNIRNHICDICGSAYKQWSSLKEHMENKHMEEHKREKDPSAFPCEKCGKTFAFRRLLNDHAKLHSGQLYNCGECGQSFRHPKYLTKHLRQHKEIVKLRCTMCDKEYVQKVGLRLHMKKIHGVVIDTTQKKTTEIEINK